jgi:2-oxoglutarate ferredoxin oxidoreductase subunit alpha
MPRQSAQRARPDADNDHRNGDFTAIAVTGAGGRGAITAGEVLLAAAGKAGLYGLMARSAGPQIRGGESAALLRFGSEPIGCLGDTFDLLAALDWGNYTRFVDEIPLGRGSIVLFDLNAGPVPAVVLESGAELRPINYASALAGLPDGRENMVAVGALGAAAGLPLEALLQGADRTLQDKPPLQVEAARQCIRIGYGLTAVCAPRWSLPEAKPVRWNISGNEAAGLGALRAGVRFAAGYPITPATDLLEWLAPRLEQLGGVLLQAEDELAAVNMIIGSAFGGVPSLTRLTE